MLLSLVNGVIDIGAIEQDKFEEKAICFKPLEVISFIESMFKMQAQMVNTSISHKVVLPIHLKDGIDHGYDEIESTNFELPETLYGDELRLKQVLINLVKNALKFTYKGQVKMYIAYDEVAQILSVNVVDNGKGITAEEIPNLFQKFGKLKRTAEDNHGGIGLGLLICQSIVRANGGSISVHSKG